MLVLLRFQKKKKVCMCMYMSLSVYTNWKARDGAGSFDAGYVTGVCETPDMISGVRHHHFANAFNHWAIVPVPMIWF